MVGGPAWVQSAILVHFHEWLSMFMYFGSPYLNLCVHVCWQVHGAGAPVICLAVSDDASFVVAGLKRDKDGILLYG